MNRRRVVFLSACFPNPVSAFIAQHGYLVLEAQSVDEALALCTVHDVDAVIVANELPGLAELRQCRITLNLSIGATGSDVLFELSHLAPTSRNFTIS